MPTSQLGNYPAQKTLSPKELEEIRNLVMKQKGIGREIKDTKDAIFRRRINIDSINKEDDIYRTRMFFSTQQTKMAVRFMNKSQIIFNSRDPFSHRKASEFTKLYAYDYDYNLWNIMEFYQYIDIDNFGVSPEVSVGWDENKKVPEFHRIHPRSIYPDPDGYGTINTFNFFGFDLTKHKQDLLKMKLHDIEKVAMSINQYEANIKQEEKSNRGMSTSSQYFYDKDTGQCTIYHHFFKRKGKCLLAYMYDDILLEVVQIPRIGDTKSSKYWAPVILHYEFPDARDPYGWSLWDTMEDDIKLKNLLVNLFKINIVKNVTGDKMFFDAEAFPNLATLEKQTLYNKYYPVKRTDYTRPIQDLIYRIPEKVVGQDARQLLRECENEAQKQTHIDSLQQGVADSSINTASEAKITQSNANLLQSLTDKILGRGRVHKARVYLKQTMHYLSEKDEKFVRITKGMNKIGKILKRENIISENEYDIEEINESELRIRNDAVLGRLRSWLQILSADPNTPPTTLRNIKLLIAQKELLSVDEIDMLTYSPEIDKTLEEVELLSNDIDVEFADTNVDWFLKIWIYQQAQDTPAKERALRACHMMYQMQGGANQQLVNQIDDTSAMQGATSKFIENEGKQSLQQSY